MANRFIADSLDLSRLPDPTLVEVDFEKSMLERRAALIAGMAAAGIDYDVDMLETDPGMIVEEVDNGREMTARAAINAAGKANMLAFSSGADLEQLAALHGLVREVVRVRNDGTIEYESDDRLRRRAQLAVEAFTTAGSAGAYLFHALTADPTIADASVVNPGPGQVVVTVMGDGDDPTPTNEQVENARARCFRTDIKPLTDILTVQGATVVPIDLEANLTLYRGPDATAVTADALAALNAFLALNKKIGRDLKLVAWAGRLSRDTVFAVTPVHPTADVVADTDTVIWVRSIVLNITGIGE